FVEQEDILEMFEGMVKFIFKEVKGIEYTEAVQRMTWDDAMWNYGIDKPDIRFGMPVINLKTPHIVFEAKDKSKKAQPLGESLGGTFKVFTEAETIVAIAVPNAAEYSRKQTDELIEWVKRPQIGMGGLAFVK